MDLFLNSFPSQLQVLYVISMLTQKILFKISVKSVSQSNIIYHSLSLEVNFNIKLSFM